MADEEVVNVDEEEQVSEPVDEVSDSEESEDSKEQATDEESETSGDEDGTSGDDDDADAESEESTEEDEPEGSHKKTANERIQELINDKREMDQKFAKLEEKFEQQREEVQHTQSVDVQALNEHLGKLTEEIEDLRLDGKHLDATKKEQEKYKLLDEYSTWQKESSDRETRISDTKQTQAQREEMLSSFDAACIFIGKEKAIPEDMFNTMGKEFSAMTADDKVFAGQVLEVLQRQGPIHAANFVHDAVKSRMKEKESGAAAAKVKKEAAKNTSVQSSTSAVKTTGLNDKMTTKEWMKQREKDIAI